MPLLEKPANSVKHGRPPQHRGLVVGNNQIFNQQNIRRHGVKSNIRDRTDEYALLCKCEIQALIKLELSERYKTSWYVHLHRSLHQTTLRIFNL